MRFLATRAIYKDFIYGFFLFALLFVSSITAIGQDENSCRNCPCCAKPPRCTGDVFRPKCMISPSCTCDCAESTCDCHKNICYIECYDLSNKAKNKSFEAGLLTLSLIKDERVTEQELNKNRDEYVNILEKLLNNRISSNTYEVEYFSKKVRIGFTNEGFRLVSQFKEDLKNGTPNSPRKRKNILQIIGGEIKHIFT